MLIPGVVTQTQDVGGTAFSATAIAIHGSRFNEQQLLYDGVFYNHGAGSGGNFNTIVPNDATVQEVSLEVGGTSAESPNGGPAHQHHPARRRQHVQGLLLRLLHEQQTTGRQPG